MSVNNFLKLYKYKKMQQSLRNKLQINNEIIFLLCYKNKYALLLRRWCGSPTLSTNELLDPRNKCSLPVIRDRGRHFSDDTNNPDRIRRRGTNVNCVHPLYAISFAMCDQPTHDLDHFTTLDPIENLNQSADVSQLPFKRC